MTTLVAALVAATAALLVAVIERIWVARNERERWELSDKRQVYARFLAACSGTWLQQLIGDINHEAAFHQLAELAFRRAELELVAVRKVRAAAAALFDEALASELGKNSQSFRRLEQTFIEVAREDLGYRS